MTVINKVPIREFSGKIIGFLESDAKGNQQVRDFSLKILGFYDKTNDVTRDFYGKIITRGNTVIGLLYQNLNR